MLEIEKTYLLKEIPAGLAEARRVRISDKYVPIGGEHPRLRIREMGDKLEMTKKVRTHDTASIQEEHTIPLSADELVAFKDVPGYELRKFRHYLPWNGREVEVDLYLGPHEGLGVAELEFETREAMEAGEVPDFCGADVSEEDLVAAGYLSEKTFDEIKDALRARYGYEPLALPAELKN